MRNKIKNKRPIVIEKNDISVEDNKKIRDLQFWIIKSIVLSLLLAFVFSVCVVLYHSLSSNTKTEESIISELIHSLTDIAKFTIKP